MMSSEFRVLTLSLLILASLAACGTTEEAIPPEDASADTGDGSASVDAATDAVPDGADDPSIDARDDTGGCEGSNPAESCMDFGCPEGQECVAVPDGCASSHCSCDEGGWICTADCGPEYACTPIEAECPTEEPEFGGACSGDDLYCEFGMECCCGDCYGAIFCDCFDGVWACGATDACFIPSCEDRPCASDLDCEGGGFPTICVDGLCKTEAAVDGWSTGPDVGLLTGCEGADSDAYELHSAVIEGESLVVSVSYSGGCEEHLFRTCWDGSFMESFPVQARLELQHDGNDDACEAEITEELRIPLGVLRDAYREGYGSGAATIIIRLGEESVNFEFDGA